MSFKKLALASGVVASLLAGTAYASVIDRPFFQVLGVVVVWGGTDFADNGGTAPVVSDFVLLTPASGSAGADLIAGDVFSVVTGSLDSISGSSTGADGTTVVDPITGATTGGTFTDGGTTAGVLDAGDTLAAFGLDANTDVAGGLVASHNSSFYVASNAAFDIFAQTTNVVATGDFGTNGLDESNISFAMDITVAGDDGLAFGTNAQDPSTGGNGIEAAIDSLDDLNTQSKVFDGGQRTAASVGNLAAQSVRFDSVYSLDSDTGTAGIQGYDLSQGVGTLSADVTYTVFVP
ncbi:MAG: hypothetical protein ABJG88_08120 [Litorimonas sp.]